MKCRLLGWRIYMFEEAPSMENVRDNFHEDEDLSKGSLIVSL